MTNALSLSRIVMLCLTLVATMLGQHVTADDITAARGKIVVANRAAGSISVIDTYTDTVVGAYALPTAGAKPEPMYVVYSPAGERVFVGDRANNRVVVFDAVTFAIQGVVKAGAGVFHMWADGRNGQLWVSNDIDNTITVIDPIRLKVISTVPIPRDLSDLGAKPHDVILDPMGRYAYVTIVSVPGANDFVVKFSTKTFKEVVRAAVGKDPHVSLARQDNLLYVPSQNSNVVNVLNRDTLAPVTDISVPGAHGAGMARNGNVFYTTNLPGSGSQALFAIDTKTNSVIGSVDTSFPVPHNIALTPNSRKLYVTHSGATANKVSVFEVQANNAVPTLVGFVEVGFNPFGLAYVP